MAEARISASQGAMRSLPGKLESLLSELRDNEKSKIRALQGDLQELINNYLMEPSEVESHAQTASFWMKDVRDLSFEIDDFADELAHAVQKLSRPRFRFREKLKRRRWIAEEISGFRVRVKEAIQRHKDYNLGDCKWRPSRRSAAGLDDDRGRLPSPGVRLLVGMGDSTDQICGWLANSGQADRMVASIVGTGGVGKTTLAREVYRKLAGQFRCRAFVQTSRRPDTKRLLTSILEQVGRRRLLDACDVRKLASQINAHLRDKTYLIVIDDLWTLSTWDIVSHALPKGNCCNRILTTTEVVVVAQTCCADNSRHIFKKEPLSEDESRELFSGTVFAHQSEYPLHLKEVSNEIIKRSGHLPLVINTLASILARQPASIGIWNYIKNSLSSDLITNGNLEGIKQILNLGYDNLPHSMKACMLYLTMYDEECVIWKDDLVKQWIAEGFVCTMEGDDEEEAARSYFDVLINMGMIQPVDINCNDEILSCRVHRMVLHFIRYKSVEENFSVAIDHSETTIRLADKVRWLALHFGSVEDATLPAPASMRLSQVRTLAFCGLVKCMPSILEFRFLQSLILKLWADPDKSSENLTGSDDPSDNLTAPVSCNLTEISELFRLRYLHVDARHMSVELPSQIQWLKSLMVLEIDAEVTAVPSDIVDLRGLLYLNLPSVAHLSTGIGRMTCLRTLGVFDLSKNSTENVTSLGELTNLQDLRLTCSTSRSDNLERNLECLGSIIRKLSNLKRVTLVPVVSSYVNAQDDARDSGMSISWHGISVVPLPLVLLQRLELSRCCCVFSSLPEWTKELTQLGILKISVRKLSNEDVVILKGLHALTALSLYIWTAPARRIVFDCEGFLVLKYFKFVCTTPCVVFLSGAMPNVRKLKLGFNADRVDQYSLVAAGLEGLTNLNEISTKIGGAGVDESGRRFAESALTDALSKHRSISIIVNVQWVDWNFCGDKEAQKEKYKEAQSAGNALFLYLQNEDGFREKCETDSGGSGDIHENLRENMSHHILSPLDIVSRLLEEIRHSVSEGSKIGGGNGQAFKNTVQLVGYYYATRHLYVRDNGDFVSCKISSEGVYYLEFLYCRSLDKHLNEEYCHHDWRTRYSIITRICEGYMAWRPVCNKDDVLYLGVIIILIMAGPLGYYSCADVLSQDLIKLIHKSWMKRIEFTPMYASPQEDCRQVKRCIELVLRCMDADKNKRPTVKDIVRELKQTETASPWVQAKFAKIGQWGGIGGGPRDIEMAPHRLKSLTIGSGKVIYSLEFSYDDHHEKNHITGPWGGHGPEGHGNKFRIVLQPTEFLTVVSGTIGPYDSAPAGVIKSLTFITTAGRYGPFGEEKGTPFQIPVQSNGSIVGFFARAGWYLDAFGIYVKPMQETEEAGLAKIGPWGGNGGQVRDLKMPPQRLESVTICSGTVLNSLTFIYHGHDGKKHTAGPWGASTGNPDQTDTILLCSSEFLTGVRGTTGPFDPASSDVIVTSLTLITNTHSYGPFGQGRGTSFQIPLWGKGSIVGFFGCSESYINAIGVYVNPYLEAMQKELVSSREPRLTKIGPWGGNGDKGNVRYINAKMEPQHLESVTVSFGSVINSLSFSYIDFKGVKHNVGPWGTPSGNSYKIVLESSEVLQGVSGTVGSSDGTSSNLVTSLTFATDQARAYGPFGAGGGTPFSAAAAAGNDGPVVAFFGRAGLCLEALGVYVHRY